MVEDIKGKYPKTWEVLVTRYIGRVSPQLKTHKWLFWKTVIVKTKEEVLRDRIRAVIDKVTEPVWSLCEDLLNGGGEVTVDSKDSCNTKVVIGGLIIRTAFDGYFSKIVVEGNIFNTQEEKYLFYNTCDQRLKDDKQYTKDLLRNELLSYYKGKGEINDK